VDWIAKPWMSNSAGDAGISNFGSDDKMEEILQTVAGPAELNIGEGAFTESFPLPIPSTGVTVFCNNIIDTCSFQVFAIGY
jgi:hypothetical protein